MNAQTQNGAVSVRLGGSQCPPPYGTLALSIAAQDGKRSFLQAALGWLRKSVSPAPAAPGCVLCAAGHSADAARLARIVALLPVGRKITVPAISAILNERFSTISSDLHLLVHQLRLPIKRKHQGYLLTEPIRLCKNCARLGEQLRQVQKIHRLAGTADWDPFCFAGSGEMPAGRPTEGWDQNSSPPPS